MKKWLKYTSLFLLPIVLVLISVDIFYRTVPTNYKFKHEQLLQRKDSIEILVFGDSHTMYGINPDWLDKRTFNLANLSQTIYFDELLFQKYIKQLTHLKYVIFPLEYTTMSQVDNTQEDVWRKYFYDAQMDINVPLIKWYDPKKYSLALSQKLSRTFQALNIWKQTNTLVNCDHDGWGLGYNSVIDSVEIVHLAKVISRKHDDSRIDISKNIERIKRMIKICDSKKIKVVLINMPVTKEYFSLLNANEVTEILNQSMLLDRENSHVKNLNLIDDVRFELNDFQDADHLNDHGAKKCSLIINEFIRGF
jgi:hypothetical protein